MAGAYTFILYNILYVLLDANIFISRFAKHPSFCFAANNMLMRQQVRPRSIFCVKRTANDPRAQWDLAQIQEAFVTKQLIPVNFKTQLFALQLL